METEAAAPAPEAAAPAADPMEAAVTAIRAREEAADAAGKGSATTPVATAPSKAEAKSRPRPGDIAALAAREWRAQQAEQAAKATGAKYAPIEDALSKKDLRGALELIIKDHGFTFANVVETLTQEKEPEKTAEQIADERVRAALAERDAQAQKERDEARSRESEAKLVAVKGEIAQMADATPERWELAGLVPNVADLAWNIIEGHWVATAPRDAAGNIVGNGEKLSHEAVLDLIEAKLREKRDARRPKQETGKPTAGAKPAGEAAKNGKGGRVQEPSFSNRATSAATAVTDPDDGDETASLSEYEAIDRAARRAKISLR